MENLLSFSFVVGLGLWGLYGAGFCTSLFDLIVCWAECATGI